MASNSQQLQSNSSVSCKLCQNKFGTKYELNKHMAGHIVRWQISRLGTTQDKECTRPNEGENTPSDSSIIIQPDGRSDERESTRSDEIIIARHNESEITRPDESAITQPVEYESAQPINEPRRREGLEQCEVCQRFFKTKHALNVHMHTVHIYKDSVSNKKKEYSVIDTSGGNLPITMPTIKKIMVNKPQGREQKIYQFQFETCCLTYECKICGSALPTKEYFDFHMLKHTGGLSRCSQCIKVFTSKDALDVHITTSHRVHFFRCLKCNEFILNCSMLQHINQHRVELCTGVQQPVVAECTGSQQAVIGVCPETQKPVINVRSAFFNDVCTLCDVQFLSQSRADEHFLIYHNPKKEPFPKCRRIITYHLSSRMGVNCKHCSRYLCSNSGFEEHLKTCPKAQLNCIDSGDQKNRGRPDNVIKASEMKTNECDFCKRKFKSSIALKYHAIACKYRIKCQHCSRHFKSNLALTHHLKLCKLRLGTVECRHCRHLFKSSLIMNRHSKNCKCKVALFSYIKRCKRKNRCESCGSGFTSGLLLKSHLQSCNATVVCQSVKRVRYKDEQFSLKKSDVCTRERSPVTAFICANCQCSFTSKSLLDSHVESCSVAHRCECRYKLESEGSLYEHMKCHVITEFGNVQTYKCKFCCERFSTTVAVQDHLVAKHSVKMPISFKGSNWISESGTLVGQNIQMQKHSVKIPISRTESEQILKKQNINVIPKQKTCVYSCGKCGDIFGEKVYRDLHMDSHKSEYTWIPEFGRFYADVYRERFESHKWKIQNQNRREETIDVVPYQNLKLICDVNNTSSAVGNFRLKFV